MGRDTEYEIRNTFFMNFIRSGFRTVRQSPALVFAEIAWRWAFGAAAWLLVVFTLRTIMEGIDVSSAEATLARTNDAYLIADAMARVLVQVLPRFAAAMLLIIPLLAAAWTLAATIGRAVTMQALLSVRPDNEERVILSKAERSAVRPDIQERVLIEAERSAVRPDIQERVLIEAERSASDARPQRRIHGFRLFRLNCLRAVFTLATFLAFFGTIFLVSAQVTPATTPGLAPAYVLAWFFLAIVVACFWGLVNWFLALAPIFIVRDGLGAWKAIAASVALYRDRKSDYVSIASWFGFFRGAALLVAVVAGLSAVATSVRAGLIVSIVIALIYFAIADWLYVARLAAYVELAGFSSPQLSTSVTEPQSSIPPAERETEPETEPETHSGLS